MNEVQTSEADLKVVVMRVFDAPARLLFKAFSQCQHIKRWFGPVGWPVTMCEIDFREGGRWRFAMTGHGGQQQTPFGGTYREIVPDKRIVYDNAFELPGAETMVVTITFDEAADGKTTLTYDTVFASPAMYASHVGSGIAEGIGSGLDQLADLVAEMA